MQKIPLLTEDLLFGHERLFCGVTLFVCIFICFCLFVFVDQLVSQFVH